MKFSDPNEKFEVVEVEMLESDATTNRMNPEAAVRVGNISYAQEAEDVRPREKQAKAKLENKTPYAWAFFLFCLFAGLSFTATGNGPQGLFLGLGTGFLFFIEPIYNKLMRLIDKI
ncbi:MAG: hypothetical protein EAZ89_07445 [Bacteroidetes bacterium]|nr:MAG: hypothetical protein EAZ89_07445 [Bacteroidota bacterium]